MLNPQRLNQRQEQKREDLFIERYDGLLVWALRLTGQDRSAAEDLVQDAFIQFVLGRTSLEEIENIDGYLRRMLRYMYLSRISRNGRKTLDQMLSITDFDSFHQSWRAIEPSRQLQAREELSQICSYACSRKETSRAGAVLILRFFHEYLPTEIAQVLRSSRHCVDQWQRLARTELKLYMSGRRGLRFLNSKVNADPGLTRLTGTNGDPIGELRWMIFRSRQGDCLTAEQLREIYQLDNDDHLTTARLGHIVSCGSCLDAVNGLLDLPFLAERYRDGTNDTPGEPPGDQNLGGPSSSGPTDVSKGLRQKVREVAEHKPKELRIFVNGSLVGSLKVNSALSELDLSLGRARRPEFVEIFSEQDIRLLFLGVSVKALANAEQWVTVELSEGRTLNARLRTEGDSGLHIVYQEEVAQEAEVSLSLAPVQQHTISLLPVAGSLQHPEAIASESGVPEKPAGSGLAQVRRCWNFITRAITQRTANTYRAELENCEPTLNGILLSGQISPRQDSPFWARPGLAVVLTLLVTVGAFLWLKPGNTPSLNATSLLERASAAAEMSGRIPDQVTHRFIEFEQRRIEDGAIVSRKRVEIWHDLARSERALKLSDDSGQLIAGLWQRANGTQTVYHHGSRRSAQGALARPTDLLLNLNDIWQLDLSAKTFVDVAGETANAQLSEHPDRYIITLLPERAVGATVLLKATLTLHRQDLRVVEQTLLVRRGGETREYHFVETGFEVLSRKNLPPKFFEPEAASEGRNPGAGMRGEKAIAPSPVLPLSSALVMASAELEIDVAYLLNQVKADRREQLSLSRTSDGRLRVEGVVDTEERKTEVIRALAPVSGNPAVKIAILTIADAMRRRANDSPGKVTITEAEEAAEKVAVDEELRDHFSARSGTRLSQDELDEAVRSFSTRIVNRSYRASFQAIELNRLVNRFARFDMRTVTPDARSKYLQMIREHSSAIERETAVLRKEIQPVFFFGLSSGGVADEPTLEDDAQLADAVERLHKLTLANNEAIRSALTISSQSSGVQLKSQQFWRTLLSAERLASRIKRY